jgi:hypothetical protein
MPSGAKKSAAQSSSLALFARNFLKSPFMLGSVIPMSLFFGKRHDEPGGLSTRVCWWSTVRAWARSRGRFSGA